MNELSKKITAVVASAAAVILIAYAGVIVTSDETDIPTPPVTEKLMSSYLIQLQDSSLVVYLGDEVYRSYDINPTTMTDYDLSLLRQGIKADTEEKMRRVIEDYTS